MQPFPFLFPALRRCRELTAVHLHLWELPPTELPSIISQLPSFTCLSSLRLTARLSQQNSEKRSEVSELYIALTSSPLPLLRHLRLQQPVLGDDEGQQLTAALLTAVPAFVTAYAQQLLTLELSHGYKTDVVHAPPSASTAQAMTAARCTS